ncbi:C1 family peptidase [Methanosphaera sp.]
MNRKLLFILLIFTLLVSVTTVQAENTNNTINDDSISTYNDTTTHITNYETNNKNLKKDTENTYYINSSVTEDGDGSEEHPWNSISQSAFDSMNNNSTVYIANGVYTFNYLNISNDITIIGENAENTVIDGVNGLTSVGLLNISGNTIINNITFANTQNTAIINQKNLTLDNARFYNNTVKGEESACINNDGILNIKNTIFTNIYSVCGAAISSSDSDVERNVLVDNCTFINCTAKNMTNSIGGVAYFRYSNVTITNSKFTNCKSGMGSIFLLSRSKLNMNNCEIKNNGAYNSSSLISSYTSNITLNNILFEENKVNSSGLYVTSGTLDVYNSQFKNNSAYNTASCIYVSEANTTINNTYFTNNQAFTDIGGTIYVNNSYLIINNSQFNNNLASMGGAIVIHNGTGTNFNLNKTLYNATIINTTFTNNTAKYEGGAIYDVYSTLSIESSTFTNNTARSGGAIYTDNLKLIINNSNFTTNTATKYGGVIYANENNITLINTMFTENNAKQALDIYSTHTKETNFNSTWSDKYETSVITEVIMESEIPEIIIKTVNDTNISSIPAAYDSRDYGYVTSIKNQGPDGNCWAFASIATLESNILKAINESYNFSENHVKNIMALFSQTGWNIIPNTGGINEVAFTYFVNWLGPVNDTIDEYKGNVISPTLKSLLHITNIYTIPSRTNATDNDLVKEAIMKYGSVYSNIYVSPNVTQNIYSSGEITSNHAISLVGWDDNYSRYNFDTTPPGDGAFILKNSWGTNVGYDGYFYVSYYDTTILNKSYGIGEGAFVFIVNDTEVYDKIYQYDLSGLTDWMTINSSSTIISNEFTITDNEIIKAFGTYVINPQYNYTAKISVNGEIKSIQTGQFTHKGYETIKLDTPVATITGDRVVIELEYVSDSDVIYVPVDEKVAGRIIITNKSSINGTYYDDKIPCLKLYSVNQNRTTTIQTEIIQESLNKTQLAITIRDNEENKITSGTITLKDDKGNIIDTIDVSDEETIMNLTELTIGEHDIFIEYDDNIYESSNTTVIIVNKLDSIITVDPVIGSIGENITLTAHITDGAGNSLTGGNIVFKLNGKTLRIDGSFNSTASPLKFHVVNGTVTYTLTADLYLRNAKNLSASYSGNSLYKSSVSNVTTAQVTKRRAAISVTIISPTQQDSNIIIVATVADVTKNGQNTTAVNEEGYVIFKVNGVSLKDENGQIIKVKVDDNIATCTYHIPVGMASVDGQGNLRNYTVEAVYQNDIFYPDARNTTVFNVEKSNITVNINSVIINNSTKTITSITGNMTDFHGNLLVGTNKVCIKVNGKSLKDNNNNTMYFTVTNGIIDISNINTTVRVFDNITIVTGENKSYKSGQATTTELTIV